MRPPAGGRQYIYWHDQVTRTSSEHSCSSCPVYGYDPSATLNDAATLNDTTSNDATHNDATHDDLATPTTTTRPTLNVNADWKA